MAAKYHSAAIFIAVTSNETGNATVAYFSGDLNKENLEKVSLNDIPSNACRIKIAGKDPVACDLFFTNILEIVIEQMIGFDMKSKLPKQKGGLFGVPQAFVGGIESQGKGTLHVHMIVFLAGFPRDSDEMVKMMVEDKSFKERLIKYFSSVVYCSALDAAVIIILWKQ